ncbi:AAA family ATPase [Nocardia sp. NPDC004604]|uniref:AAA family ATPase n=1 Tax=Nocardia sp. NPDC004604 TaxID=3157013 RepID=UPI0033AAD0E7
MGEPNTPVIHCDRHKSYQLGCKNCEWQLEQQAIWERQQAHRRNSAPSTDESQDCAADSSAAGALQLFPIDELQPGVEIHRSEGVFESHPTHPQLTVADRAESHPSGIRKPRYVDMAALLNGTLPEPLVPDVCRRSDGVGLFYRGQYNVLFGDPETGKTLLTDYATVQELAAGGRVLRLDLDHNGPKSAVGRLLGMGAEHATVTDQQRFLYIEPEDRRELKAVIAHMAEWLPTLVILDSVGELVPMFGGNSNSSDEFTNCHRTVVKPLVQSGACVIAIDHLAKGDASRLYGANGTMAKKRTTGGTSIRVVVDAQFTPGKGGSAHLYINKDRHGGLRDTCEVGKKEPCAGKFILRPNGSALGPEVQAPNTEMRELNVSDVPPEDIAAMGALDPPPKSARDARARLGWGELRSRNAFKAWRTKRWPGETAA